MRIEKNINKDWFFYSGDESNAKNTVFDHSSWDRIEVPHDWAIDSPVDPPDDFAEADLINPSNYRWKAWQGFYDRYGVGWYRKELEFPKGQRHFIEFDGVFHECDVYLNGNHLGRHRYGYTSFGYEVSKYVKEGINILAVRVDNSFEHLSDRWYSGCGIYRPVKIIATSYARIKRHGIVIKDIEVSKGKAEIEISVQVDEAGEKNSGYTVSASILSNERTCAQTCVEVDNNTACLRLAVENPDLWSVENPNLYTITVQLKSGGEPIDKKDMRYGFRKIEMDAKDGLRVNGEKTKLKGVNLHHGLGAIGASWNKGLMKQRMITLKEIGCNAIRTCHNPPASEFLDLCDEMGFLVMDEAFDKWKTLRYGLIFEECWQEDLLEMINRDRNHPCIFCWSVGNEVNNQAKEDMLYTLAMLVEKTKQEDPSRPVTYAMEPHVFDENQRKMLPSEKAKLTQKINKHVDIVSGNYHEQYYDEYHKLMPDMMFIGTETLPFFRHDINGNTSYLHKNPWFDVTDNDFVLGQFIWPGIDYLGEAVWPARMWSGGIIDSTGKIKERGYLTQSLWSSKPMVHISVYDEDAKDMRENGAWGAPPMVGHWNMQHKTRPFVKAFLFTNCEKAAIYLNDKLVKTIYTSNMENGYLEIYLPNIPGLLSAKGIVDGKTACEHVLKTADEPDHIQMAIENDISDECMDIAIVSAKVVDANGTLCPHFDGEITFLASGAEVIVTDSGDSTDHIPYKSNTRKALLGRCVVFLKLDKRVSANITAQSGKMKSSLKLVKM